MVASKMTCGAQIDPSTQTIEFEALINIRPRQGNRSIVIQDETLRAQVAAIARRILGGVE